MADQQSETLVKGLLEEVVSNYEMKFCRAETDLMKLRKK